MAKKSKQDTASANLRNICLNMLSDTLDAGKFSNIVMDRALKEYTLSPAERSFLSRLYLGVIERLIYIDYIINAYSSVNTQKMKPVVLNILRMSVYQLKFMDAVPDYAVVSEALSLCETRKLSGLKAFVNGLLRAIIRNDKELNPPANVLYSVPKWMYELVEVQYGKEAAENFFEDVLKPKDYVVIRPNTTLDSAENIARILREEGMDVADGGTEFTCFKIKNFESLSGSAAFKKGLFRIQDIGSQTAAHEGYKALSSVSDKKDPLIIDICAAPGGKSLCMAEYFPGAAIIANDKSEQKAALIKENAERLSIKNIAPSVRDGRVLNEGWAGKADLVIADVPCSGLGVIGQKPDIKLRVKKKDLEELCTLQYEIAKTASAYVREGGIMVYSTCTINRAENEENAGKLAQETGLSIISEKLLLPGRDGTEGFYICVLKK